MPAGAPAGVFCVNLLLNEGHAVGALVDGRVRLMGADADAIEGTVILASAVVAALGDMAFDAVVCFFRKMTHSYFLLFESTLSVPRGQRDIRTNFFKKWPVDKRFFIWYHGENAKKEKEYEGLTAQLLHRRGA